MALRTINIVPDFNTGALPPVVRLNQYDTAFEINFDLTGHTCDHCRIEGTKKDKTGFQETCTYENGHAVAAGNKQITIFPGRTAYELVLFDANGARIGTTNFVVDVEPAALSDDTAISESVMTEFREMSATAATAAANAKKSETAAGASADQAAKDSLRHTVTNFTISHSGTWASATVNGGTYYKYTQKLTTVYDECPDVYLGTASGVMPTDEQQTAYMLLAAATVDSAVPCLYLYATAKPASDFVISVRGVK